MPLENLIPLVPVCAFVALFLSGETYVRYSARGRSSARAVARLPIRIRGRQ